MTHGTLRLTAARRGARTVISELYRTAPFHPGPPHYRGEMAEVILQEVSPGLFPGDRLETEVRVADGAALIASGQGATRLYPARDGAAISRVSLSVASTGTLWWLPGPLIPFRDADYESRMEISLDGEARFACLEVITPGRTAMGERFAYRRLDLRLGISVDRSAKLIERSLLEPAVRPLGIAGSHGAFACAGSLVTIGYSLPRVLPCRTDVWLGGDGGAELAVVRGLASSAEALRGALLGVLGEMAGSESSERPAKGTDARAYT